MKIRRYKKVHRYINFYANNFGFRKPYQILVDGTFCYAALNNKVNIRDNIPRYLQGEVKLLTTPCVIIEMEKLGHKLSGAIKILKDYAVHKCCHSLNPITGSECFLSMLGEKNDKHYIIATQDRDLQNKIRSLPGVPLLYLHIKTPVLEEPSEQSHKVAKEKMSGLWDSEKRALEELKNKNGLTSTVEDIQKKKKRKGPNPLSCKKKKKKPFLNNEGEEKTNFNKIDKKKRKKIRIPDHVKQELNKKKIEV